MRSNNHKLFCTLTKNISTRCIPVGILFAVCCLLSVAEVGAVRRALVIGLGEQEDPAWGKINGDNDVAYVSHYLQKCGYTDVRTLKNRQATKKGIVDAFQRLAADCKPGDRVYVHYSGHGQLMTDLDGDEAAKWSGGSHADWDEAWIPYDAWMVYGTHDRGEKHLCDDEVATLLHGIRKQIGKKGELIVAVDACHSGDATMGECEDEAIRGIGQKFVIPKPTISIPAHTIKEDWLTISACLPYQLSAEVPGKRVGKLTYSIYLSTGKLLQLCNADMERQLKETMNNFKGRIRQTPMVRGKR